MRLWQATLMMSMLCLLSACDSSPTLHSYVGPAPAAKGIGRSVTRTQPLTVRFDKIVLLAPAELHARIGQPASMTIEFDEKLMPDLRILVAGETLIISSQRKFINNAPLKIEVFCPKLNGVTIGTEGQIDVEGLNSHRFDVAVGTVGKVKASGTCRNASVIINGPGSVDLLNLHCHAVDVNIAGAGSAVLNASERIDAILNGTGSIKYSGHAVIHKSGAGGGSCIPL